VFELKYCNKYRGKELELERDHGALRSAFPHTEPLPVAKIVHIYLKIRR